MLIVNKYRRTSMLCRAAITVDRKDDCECKLIKNSDIQLDITEYFLPL